MPTTATTTNIYVIHDRVVLTDAEIKALPTTPIQLLAAPGVGLRHEILSMSLQLVEGSGGYTVPNTANGTSFLQIYFANNSIQSSPIAQLYNDPFVSADNGFNGTNSLFQFFAGSTAQGNLWIPPIMTRAAEPIISYADGLTSYGEQANHQINMALMLRILNGGTNITSGGGANNSLVVNIMHFPVT